MSVSNPIKVGYGSNGIKRIVFTRCIWCKTSFEPEPHYTKALFHFKDTHGITPEMIMEWSNEA